MFRTEPTGRLPEYEVFVFDLDDTLILERDYVRSGFKAVGRYLWLREGISGFAEQAWRLFLMGRRCEVFDEVLLSQGISPGRELVDELVAVYRTHRPRINLLPDARELIRRVKNSGRRIALISDGPAVSQRAKLRAVGLESCFDSIVLTGDYSDAFRKPGRPAFEWVRHFLNADPREMIYVADNPLKDFTSPIKLGWGAVRVRRPGGIYSHIDGSAEVPEVTSLFELPLTRRGLTKPIVPASAGVPVSSPLTAKLAY